MLVAVIPIVITSGICIQVIFLLALVTFHKAIGHEDSSLKRTTLRFSYINK